VVRESSTLREVGATERSTMRLSGGEGIQRSRLGAGKEHNVLNPFMASSKNRSILPCVKTA
jgi:hypothetical protein